MERALPSSNYAANNIISTTDSTEQNSPHPANNDSSEGGASSSSSLSSINHLSPPSMDANNGGILHGHVEEVPIVEKPKFLFTPVNRFGNTVKEGEHLENTGKCQVEGWNGISSV